MIETVWHRDDFFFVILRFFSTKKLQTSHEFWMNIRKKSGSRRHMIPCGKKYGKNTPCHLIHLFSKWFGVSIGTNDNDTHYRLFIGRQQQICYSQSQKRPIQFAKKRNINQSTQNCVTFFSFVSPSFFPKFSGVYDVSRGPHTPTWACPTPADIIFAPSYSHSWYHFSHVGIRQVDR